MILTSRLVALFAALSGFLSILATTNCLNSSVDAQRRVAPASKAPSIVAGGQQLWGQCPSPEKSDSELQDLKGKVKHVRVFEIDYYTQRKARELVNEFTFDTQGNYVDIKNESRLPANKAKAPKPEYVFNDDCQPVERNGKSPELGMTRTTYLYENKKLKEEAIRSADSDMLFWKAVYTYNDQDRSYEKVETIQSHPEHYNPPRYDVYITTKVQYKLDERGNVIEETSYRPDGSLYARWNTVFDASGRPIKKTRKDNRNRFEEQDIYKYNNEGVLVEEIKYENYCFYSNGEFCEGIMNSGDAIFNTATKTSYEYDKAGNWIRKTKTLAGGENKSTNFSPFVVTIREIAYY